MENNQQMEDVIKICEKQVQMQRYLIEEGQIIEEIGGPRGLYKIVLELFSNKGHYQKKYEIQEMIRKMDFQTSFIKNLNLTLSEKDDFIDYQKMINAHIKLNISFFEIYELKLLFWEVLNDIDANINTSIRFLCQIERFRYFIYIKETLLLITNDAQKINQMIEQLDFQISQQQVLLKVFKNDFELQRKFSEMLITEQVLRKKYYIQPEIFLQQLQMSEQQFRVIINCLLKIVNFYVNDKIFSADVEIKMEKLMQRAHITKSLLEQLGGEHMIAVLLIEINKVVKQSEYFLQTIKQFPEEISCLKFTAEQEQKYDHLINNNKLLGQQEQNLKQYRSLYKNTGLEMLEFFLLSYFSEYDIYSTQDCMAGIQTFKIAKFIPVKWKVAIEISLRNLNYDQNFIQKFLQCFSKEFMQLYDDQENEYYKNQLSFKMFEDN